MEHSSYSFRTANALEHLLAEAYTRDRTLFWWEKSCISNRQHDEDISLREASKYVRIIFWFKTEFAFMIFLLKNCFYFDFIMMPKTQSCGSYSDFL